MIKHSKTKPKPPAAGDVPPGFLPQLPVLLSEIKGEAFIDKVNGTWCAQEMFAGTRLLIHKRSGIVTGTDKHGRACPVPGAVTELVAKLYCDCVLDGKLIGGTYQVFDLLLNDGQDYRPQPYGRRLTMLRAHIGNRVGPVRVVPTTTGMRDVRKFHADLKERNAEGMVYRDLCMPHTAGIEHKALFAFRITAIAQCVVAGVADRTLSVMLIYDDCPSKGLEMARVPVPADQPVPDVGAVVDIQYSHLPDKGSMFKEPVYVGVRSDVSHAACTLNNQHLRVRPVPSE